MGLEIPLDIAYWRNMKTNKLRRLLDLNSASAYPPQMWSWAAEYSRLGSLPEPEDLEGELGWDKNAGELFAALVAAGFICAHCSDDCGHGTTEKPRSIHRWFKYAGYEVKRYHERREERRAKAKSNGKAGQRPWDSAMQEWAKKEEPK